MPAATWKPNGEELRRLREERDLSQRELARLAEMDPQTIADIESGKRRRVHSRTLKKLARILLVEWEDLLYRERDAAKRLGLRRLADELAPRTPLDLLLFAHREEAQPKVQTPVGELAVFGVSELVDTFTAPAVFDGDRYCVAGEVTRQRALTQLDEAILDAAHLEGGRFEIARRVAPKLPLFTLDVLSRRIEHTRALQAHSRTGRVIKLAVRVFVARRLKADPEHVAVTNLDGGPPILRPRVVDGERWKGFELIAASRADVEAPPEAGKPHSWCLVVDEILSG